MPERRVRRSAVACLSRGKAESADMTACAPDPPRTPIVLLHGATSSARTWDPLLPMLSPKYHVFVPGLAGHRGGPPLPAEPAAVVDRVVNAMCRQLDEAAIDTAHI